ncbi:hypothetical protein V502_05988 [Pseudogymnoascus sp. VKM F-4520 (FW-2644)]|nr:hypothetical protein V502_05988 [Pseudogymnoascus sp. VKM F-4520 (FW-2644)]
MEKFSGRNHASLSSNSIAPACEIVATFIFAPMLEKFGRKPGILAASIISVAGVLCRCLQQLAKDWKVHLAGRGVNGIAIGIMFTIAPLWIGETCRPELRGFFLCFFNTSIVFGQFAIVVVSKGSSGIDGKWQWWIPVVAMYIFPLILTVVWPFFPESPYWLVRQNRTTDAKNALRRAYGFKGADSAFYDIEVLRMEEEIRITTELQGGVAAKRNTVLGVNVSAEAECFRGINRKRTLTAIFAASAQQMIRATFVIGYATYFLELIGITNYFNASVALYVVMLIASMAAFPLTEIFGRRCVPNQVQAGYSIVAIDGKQVASELRDNTVRLWDGATGAALHLKFTAPMYRCIQFTMQMYCLFCYEIAHFRPPTMSKANRRIRRLTQ